MIDFRDATWQFVAAWTQTQIDTLRQQNDAAHDAETTANLRGRIQAFKTLLALPNTLEARANMEGPLDGRPDFESVI